jgi:hypothetical protein
LLTPGKKQVTVQVDIDLLGELEKMAVDQHRGRGNLIEWLLMKAVEFKKGINNE